MKILRQRHEGEAGSTAQISPYILWLIWIVWLYFLVPTVISLVQAPPSLPRYLLMLAGLALFVSIYLWGALENARTIVGPAMPPSRQPVRWRQWFPVAVLAGLGCLVTFLGAGYSGNSGSDWINLFFFTSGFAAGRFPPAQAVRAIAVLMVVAAAASLVVGLGLFDIARVVSFVAVIGVVMISVVRAITAGIDLQAAQEEIARLAVANERLRIARDLHDLLGHNLSLIALKSELARRLLWTAPQRAEAEISDIEEVARTTLQQVREAVASYRQPSLAGELQGAQEILAAAGITFLYEENESEVGHKASARSEPFPPPVEAVLAATVREGVTNVIKHSHARHCTIRVLREERYAGVEVVDDGTSLPLSRSAMSKGSGLRGLAERVEALGGRFEAGSQGVSGKEGSGFRLAVSLPLHSNDGANRPVSGPSTLPTSIEEQKAVAVRQVGSASTPASGGSD